MNDPTPPRVLVGLARWYCRDAASMVIATKKSERQLMDELADALELYLDFMDEVADGLEEEQGA